MFNFLQKKQKQQEDKAGFEAQQAEALARGKKLETFLVEVMKVAVKHDVTVSDFKVLLHEVTRQLESAFDSRKVTDFMDKEEVTQTLEEHAPPAPPTDAEVAAEPVTESTEVAPEPTA